MLSSILKKVRQQLVLMLAVALVLVAAYVSAGRQFMPAVSGYVDFFEEQVFQRSGVPISVESLTGGFEGFNPILHVNGMSLLVADTGAAAEETALYLQKATVIVDIPQSIWQRTWVLEDFVVQALELNLDQSEAGAWQLRGLTGNNSEAVDFDSLYRSLQQVSQLSLRNVVINLHTFEGDTLSFRNGQATIANRDGTHYLHANLTLAESLEQMELSFEVTGNEFADMTGQLYVELPDANYGELFSRQSLADMSIDELFGGGNFWFTFANGELSEFVSELELDILALQNSDSDILSLQDVSGKASLSRQSGGETWQLALSDMGLSWQQLQWSPFNVLATLNPEISVDVWADNIDVSLIAQFIEDSEMLSANAQQQLAAYAPRGKLENFIFSLPLEEQTQEHLLISTNLNGVDVGSVRGSPSIWGIDGYAEIDFDVAGRSASGFAEVESNRFRMNIPTVFNSIWDHKYINGSVGFSLDLNEGMHLRLKSNDVVAETDIVDGRVQFTSIINRPNEGEPKAELELLVGALRFDAAGRAAYLPDAPQVESGLASTMQWLNGAILDGEIVNSGALFRGSTLPNSPAQTKTFQSFYLMNDGELNFSDEWPNLREVTAFVTTDDSNIDVEVSRASSLDVVASSVLGTVRVNDQGENWVSVQGLAGGATTDGLNYLQNSAVGDGLKSAFANWQTEGDFNADITVDVPLNRPQLQTEVRLDMRLQDNSLLIPDYALQIENLTGPVIFDTRTGVEVSELSGRLFEQLANIQLSSTSTEGSLEEILVQATGLATPEQLTAWPMQSQFVKDIMGSSMEGQLAYQANLSIDQSGAADAQNRLLIESTLLGASLALPHPFTKPVEVTLPLKIDMSFSGNKQMIVGTLGPTLSFDLDLLEGEIEDGLVFVGEAQDGFENLRDNDSQGLVVLGNMDRFELELWSEFLAEFNSDESVSEGMGSTIAFVDLQIENFRFYDQELNDVNMRITPALMEQSWEIALQSNSIAGQVRLPFDRNDYLSLDLQYLHLPGEESDRIGPPMEADMQLALLAEEDPIDVLADIDPRELPRMHFSTNEFRIGDVPYGNWSFTLNPNAEGAEIDDLAFDFRGLRLGLDTVAMEQSADNASSQGAESPLIPHFSWRFDGVEHESALTGVLSAGNMAEVLTANGYAPSLESSSAEFIADISWPGSPAFFRAANLSGDIAINIEDGRFLQRAGAAGALKLISILNFDAIMRRLRFSDDLLRSGLAYDEITGRLTMEGGQVHIEDRLVISGPSSLYQITGDLDLKDETIVGEMYLTLPVSNNIPWLGLLTANLPLAVGAFLIDRIFGDQVNSLTSAVYTLDGRWEDLEPEFKQAFGSPDSAGRTDEAVQ